jgi:hypothetical protein
MSPSPSPLPPDGNPCRHQKTGMTELADVSWGGHSCGSRRRAGFQGHILTVSSVSFLFFHDFLLCLEGIAVK